MEEKRFVIMATGLQRGCSPELGWECADEWEAKRLSRWLAEVGVQTKLVGWSFFDWDPSHGGLNK